MNETLATLDPKALQRLLDEQAILSLIALFDDAILCRDPVVFRRLWTADGVWEIGQHNPNHSENVTPLRAEGIDAILRAQQMFNDVNEFFFRATMRSVITISGDTAAARSPNFEIARRNDKSGYVNVAFYEDELVRHQEEWRFKARRYRYVWVDSKSPIAGGDAVPLA